MGKHRRGRLIFLGVLTSGAPGRDCPDVSVGLNVIGKLRGVRAVGQEDLYSMSPRDAESVQTRTRGFNKRHLQMTAVIEFRVAYSSGRVTSPLRWRHHCAPSPRCGGGLGQRRGPYKSPSTPDTVPDCGLGDFGAPVGV